MPFDPARYPVSALVKKMRETPGRLQRICHDPPPSVVRKAFPLLQTMLPVRASVKKKSEYEVLLGGFPQTHPCARDEAGRSRSRKAAAAISRALLRFPGVRLHGRTAADEVAVTINVVDPPDGRPELPAAEPRRRVGGLLARVGKVPCVAHDHGRGMGGVLENVVVAWNAPAFDLLGLVPDGDERVAVAVQLLLRLALRRFDHERA